MSDNPTEFTAAMAVLEQYTRLQAGGVVRKIVASVTDEVIAQNRPAIVEMVTQMVLDAVKNDYHIRQAAIEVIAVAVRDTAARILADPDIAKKIADAARENVLRLVERRLIENSLGVGATYALVEKTRS